MADDTMTSLSTTCDAADAAAAAAAAAVADPTPANAMIQIERGMLSRVLYPNPVCLLSVWDAERRVGNVMTITWLTPINNQGGFICSVNCNRHTATFIRSPGAVFVLNVPVRGMEALVLAIGSCSGASVDKFATLSIATCAPGGSSNSNSRIFEPPEPSDATQRKKPKLSRQELARQAIADAAATSIAIQRCAAHVLSRVESVQIDDGHWLLRCSQLAAWCRPEYWDGKNFIPQSADTPPYLTFLGSKVFGFVLPASPPLAAPSSSSSLS